LNPVLPIPTLLALGALVLAVASYGAWRGGASLPGPRRIGLLALRLLAVAAVMVPLFNPGKWVNPTDRIERPWLLLADVSSSMAQPAANGTTRAAAVASLLEQARARAKEADIPLRVQPFAGTLGAPVESLPAPKGDASRILPVVSQALQDASSSGEALAGMIVLSDGRQTLRSAPEDMEALGLRARSRGVVVHTVAVGGDAQAPDLALIQPRASLTAFGGQPLRIPFAIQSTGLSPLRPVVTLRDAEGREIATQTLEVPAGKTVASVIDLKAPAASARWTLDTPVVEGEVRSANNSSFLHIRVLESRTRVFLVEGAPYWDSKFLAQLLRQQPHMDVRSIHRISDERYFRIDSGDDSNEETRHPVFPDTIEELARYDLVVFGKNIDPFLTDERAALLRAYVRDHGGAVLFARGKATTGSVAALEPLEPVAWAAAGTGDFRFTPNRDGEAAGLFGEALPAPDASLWKSLPNLKDGRQVSMVKPFTRVLADGVPESAGVSLAASSGKFPALLVRRYGQGVTGLVNGDGLWKWDFFPEARELGNCYEDFWTQLIQWMASYSEFLPGQDFSLRLPATRGDAGTTLAAAISYRGSMPAPQPVIEITAPDGSTSRTTPAAVPDPSGRPLWRASFTPDKPGTWNLRVVDARPQAPPAPETLFTVPVPPTENDDLSADPAFLTNLAAATGGETMASAGFADFLIQHLATHPPVSRESGAVWQPAWHSAAIAILIAVLLSAEWFLRRRNGLA
jgi:hypothetical protein